MIASDTVGAGPVISFPTTMALAGDGDLIVGDAGVGVAAKIVRIDPDTGNRAIVSDDVIGSGLTLSQPLGGVIDTNGDLFVADSSNQVIFQIDLTTGDRTVFSGGGVGFGPGLQDPFATVVDATGKVLVTDSVDHVVFRIDPNTGIRTIISGNSDGSTPTIGTGPELDSPQGLAIAPNGDIFITDRELKQLLLIDPSGQGRPPAGTE